MKSNGEAIQTSKPTLNKYSAKGNASINACITKNGAGKWTNIGCKNEVKEREG